MIDTNKYEAVFLLNRLRKTLCYMCNQPDHKDKVFASSAAVKEIDAYLEMHGPTAHELMQDMAGLSHFDGPTPSDKDTKENEQ